MSFENISKFSVLFPIWGEYARMKHGRCSELIVCFSISRSLKINWHREKENFLWTFYGSAEWDYHDVLILH